MTDAWLCTLQYNSSCRLHHHAAGHWAAPVKATGTVRKRQAVRPVHHVQMLGLSLLQPARQAAVLDQPSMPLASLVPAFILNYLGAFERAEQKVCMVLQYSTVRYSLQRFEIPSEKQKAKRKKCTEKETNEGQITARYCKGSLLLLSLTDDRTDFFQCYFAPGGKKCLTPSLVAYIAIVTPLSIGIVSVPP
jgi:hypothetical protein